MKIYENNYTGSKDINKELYKYESNKIINPFKLFKNNNIVIIKLKDK
jgi:hypothetical protein